jgi:hypothetical protein
MADLAIRAENLGKLYRIGQREVYRTLRDTLTDAMYGPFRALGSLLPGRRSSLLGPRSSVHGRLGVVGPPSSVVSASSVIGPRSSVLGRLAVLGPPSSVVSASSVVGIIGRSRAIK